METSPFVVYTPKSLGSGRNLEAAGAGSSERLLDGWDADSCVKEPGLTPSPQQGLGPAESGSPRRPRTGLHSAAGPFAAQGLTLATKQENQSFRENSSVCLLALSVKLINPRSASVTINCTSQSCIFKQGTAYNSHLRLMLFN